MIRTTAVAAAAVLTLALAACAEGEAPPPPAFQPSLTPELIPDGLGTVAVVNGLRQPIPFSRAKGQVLVTMTRIAPDKPVETVNAECGAGPLAFARYDAGLTLIFQDDRFVGWTVDKPGIKSARGVGVGSTLAEMKAAVPGTTVRESTLGQEFSSGGMGGLLDGEGPEAKITHLWAGTTCAFR